MSITATSIDKPTVILVHGAFAESSSWNTPLGFLPQCWPAILRMRACSASACTAAL